jgi:hypothetical protein
MPTTLPTAFAPVPTGFRLPASNPPYPPAVGSALARAFHPCSDRLRCAPLGRTTPDRTQPQPTEHVARTIDGIVRDNRVMHRRDRQHRALHDQHNSGSIFCGISCVVGVQEGDAKGPRHPQHSSNAQQVTPWRPFETHPMTIIDEIAAAGARRRSNTLLTVIRSATDRADTVQTRKTVVHRMAVVTCIFCRRPHDVRSRDRFAACRLKRQGPNDRRHEATAKGYRNRPPEKTGGGVVGRGKMHGLHMIDLLSKFRGPF